MARAPRGPGYVPAQETFITGPDFRGISKTHTHGKRKREDDDERDEIVAMDESAPGEGGRRKAAKTQNTYQAVAGKASGRSWKVPGTKASVLMKPPGQVARGMKTWGDKMAEKAAKKAFQANIADAKAAAKEVRKVEHQRRAAKKTQKEVRGVQEDTRHCVVVPLCVNLIKLIKLFLTQQSPHSPSPCSHVVR